MGKGGAGPMRAIPFLSAVILTALLLEAAAAFPEDAAGPPVPPKDTREKWTVGFAALTGLRLTGADSYLIYSIPLLLKDRVSGVPTHEFSDKEMEAHRRNVIAKEFAAQIQSLSKARTERDELAFNAAANAAGRADMDKRTDALIARIGDLAAMDPATIEFASKKPVAFKDGTAQGNLFDPPRFSARELCRTADLDLLVLGSIEIVQGYLLIDVRAYDAALDRDVWTWREAAPREEIYSYLDVAHAGLLRVVVGADFAVLTVGVTPGDAAISLDGEKRTAGSLFTTPGLHVLRAEAAGYKAEQRELDLASGVETAARMELAPEPGKPMTVESDPPGATVYLDSILQGPTPWTMDRPALKRHLLLVREGYLDEATRADPLSPDVLNLRLQPDSVSPEQKQKDRRDRFYVSFGALMVAIPVPVFFFVAYQDFTAAAAKATKYGYTNAGTLSSTGSICLWSAVGTAAACAGILTYMVFTLVDYIAAADRPAG
jgi:hypothetical protein